MEIVDGWVLLTMMSAHVQVVSTLLSSVVVDVVVVDVVVAVVVGDSSDTFDGSTVVVVFDPGVAAVVKSWLLFCATP